MKMSESIADLSAALSLAQAAMKCAIKDNVNPHFKSKYATLASHVEAIKAPLAANGLSYSQFPVTSEAGVGVETILMHSSGQWISGEPYFVPVDKQNAQGVGSALTYCRRYSLAAITGIAPDDDDDGNAAAVAAPYIDKERPNTATQSAKDVFDNMDDEEKDFIRSHAAAITALYPLGDLLGYLEKANLDNEEKLALWSQLRSEIRTAIKAAQGEARTKAKVAA